jgi:hypothetical protein
MLPVLAGWGQNAKPIAYVGIIKCPNCRNHGHFHLYEVAKKASVFFVPVAKWGRKYYMVCGVCEAAVEVPEPEKDTILAESVELPSMEVATDIWNELDEASTKAIASGLDGERAFDEAVARLEEQYPAQHVHYVCSAFGRYLLDEDPAE